MKSQMKVILLTAGLKTKNEEIAVEDPSKEHIKEDTVFIAHYVINEYDYTVRYVDENGNSLINDVTKGKIQNRCYRRTCRN